MDADEVGLGGGICLRPGIILSNIRYSTRPIVNRAVKKMRSPFARQMNLKKTILVHVILGLMITYA
jgi:hypothetical protein